MQKKLFNYLVSLISLIIFCSLGLIIFEVFSRIQERKQKIETNLINEYHSELGWLPQANQKGFLRTFEMDTNFNINQLNLNDDDIDLDNILKKENILALGDSHTFAIGASTNQTWPNVLENLFKQNGKEINVHNAGGVGYSFGQYVIQYRRLKEYLKPKKVIVGFSLATDLYDIILPNNGQFIYGGSYGRAYFDLDDNNNLIEKRELVGVKNIKNVLNSKEKTDSISKLQRLLQFLENNSAMYRISKRSKIAYAIASFFSKGGKGGLIPGTASVVSINLSDEMKWRWLIIEKLIVELNKEVKLNGADLYLVFIPYVPQLYDEVWNSSFGIDKSNFSRYIGQKRLKDICQKNKINCVDTTSNMKKRSDELGEWLHYPYDAHPTPEGHRVIANTIFNYLKRS